MPELWPDLGKYAGAVLSAYAVSIALLVALVGVTLWQGRRARREMQDAETRTGRNG